MDAGESTRKPAVAGAFYPSGAGELRRDVARYIAESGVTPAPERVAAIVAPHAGYMFSGPTAGHAYARVRGKRPRRVILLGSSHRHYVERAAVFARGGFQTPGQSFPVDEAFADALVKETGPGPLEAHVLEHSLEVQLPFVGEAVGAVPIVPVLFGPYPSQWHVALGRTLAGMADGSDLVVASTDLSHFLTETAANEQDKRSLDILLRRDCAAFIEAVGSDACSMCGASAVAVAMAYALERGADRWTVLDYRTSARASGDYGRVVGYAAVSMEHSA